MAQAQHRWRFFRAGGFDQVRLDSGADLLALRSLDQKLWVALACPTATIDFDARTLTLLDTDGDGRIRARELIDACEWVGALLKDPEVLVRPGDTVPLAAIQTAHPDGKAVLDAATHVLQQRGTPEAGEIGVGQITDAVTALDASPFNGDGVITEDSADTDALKAAVKDAIASVGSEPDRSGKPGLSRAKLDAFFDELKAWAAWSDEGAQDKGLSPLGEETPRARALLAKLEAKVDDFFARVRLAGFDPRAAAALNREEKDFAALAHRELSLSAQEIAAFPLAHVEANRPLPLITGLNPAWAATVADFRDAVVKPLLGERGTLTETEWTQLRARFAAHDAWVARKKGAAVEGLGAERVRALLAGEVKAQLEALIERDLQVAPVAKALASVEKLVRLRRDLHRLCNNFVSFRDFFSRKDKAIFQAGTLYIDQRSCDLCVKVTDVAKHATLASLARSYLVYCECQRAGKKQTIAAAFTAGDSDNLMVGRNGVFYDRDGNDWDATITRIVDNPISVRQAFWAPYKKLGRFIEAQISKRAGEADTAANAKLTAAATEAGDAATTGKVKAGPPPKLDIGVVAALGVAVGGITAAFGVVMQAFFGLGVWMPLGALGVILAISGPSMAIAWLKLHKRSLGPILDGNGWAMNSPARINLPFGGSLTQTAVLPAGAARELKDPYAERKQPWGAYAAAAAALLIGILWWSGRVDHLLPEHARRQTVFATKVEAAKTPAAASPAAPAGPSAKTAQNGAP